MSEPRPGEWPNFRSTGDKYINSTTRVPNPQSRQQKHNYAFSDTPGRFSSPWKLPSPITWYRTWFNRFFFYGNVFFFYFKLNSIFLLIEYF